MKKKRTIIFLILLCLFVGSGVRIYQVNHSHWLPEKQYYSVGEKVEFGTDYYMSDSEVIDGYTIQVLGSELLEEDDFFAKYHIQGKDREMADYEGIQYYYVVEAKVSNSKEMKDGIGFIPFNYLLIGKNYSVNASMSTYSFVNPELPEGSGFSLRKGEEVNVKIPYTIFPENVVEYESQVKKKMMKHPPHLQITAYPTKKLIATQ